MALAVSLGSEPDLAGRLSATASLLEQRGYAVAPARLAGLCLGGEVSERSAQAAIAASPDLEVRGGLVLDRRRGLDPVAVGARAKAHAGASAAYLPATLAFVRALVRTAPFVISVAIAGSLASGGFAPADDVDLNLVVEDGHRHLAYVLLNALGIAHALRYRGKPVDDLSRRPLAPRVMTANLILERSDWLPLRRTDPQMALELLVQEPVFGADFLDVGIARNPALLAHFPQLTGRTPRWAVKAGRRAPGWLFPAALDGAAREVGSAAWRYMMWTRRRRPDALRRVELVRSTMRPYALFDRP